MEMALEHSRGREYPFPLRLYDALEAASEGGISESTIAWLPKGNGFMIHNRENFMEHLNHMFFSLTKFKSFQRQLSWYGFSQIKIGPRKGSYIHEYFNRGQRTSCHLMKRSKPKSLKHNGVDDISPKEFSDPKRDSSSILSIQSHPTDTTSLKGTSYRHSCLVSFLECNHLLLDLADPSINENVQDKTQERGWLLEHKQNLFQFASIYVCRLTKDVEPCYEASWKRIDDHDTTDEIIKTFGTRNV